MISFRNAGSSHSGLIPLKTAYKNRGELLRAISSKKNFFTCKHKIWGGNWLYLRPYLKAFSVFNVLETCRVYLLAIDLMIVKFIKKFIERFLEKCEIFRHGPNYVQKLYQKQPNAS